MSLRVDYRGTRALIEWLPAQPLLDSCSSLVGSCSVCLAMSATDANTTRPSIHYCMSLCTQALESWLLSSHYMFVLLFARFPVLRIRSRSATHPSVYSCQRAAFVLLQKNAFSFCTIFRCHSAKHLGSPCLVLKVLSCMVICRRFVAFFMFFLLDIHKWSLMKVHVMSADTFSLQIASLLIRLSLDNAYLMISRSSHVLFAIVLHLMSADATLSWSL